VVAAATVLAVIPVVTVEAEVEVTLVAPPAPAMEKEGRETRLFASLGGGPHGSPSRSELEVSRGDVARQEVEGPLAGC